MLLHAACSRGLGSSSGAGHKGRYQHAPMSPSCVRSTPDNGHARAPLMQVLAAMEDPRWTQLTNEIAAKDAEIKALSEQWQQCSDPALEAKLQRRMEMLQADKRDLLDLKKTLAGMVKECLHQQPCMHHACATYHDALHWSVMRCPLSCVPRCPVVHPQRPQPRSPNQVCVGVDGGVFAMLNDPAYPSGDQASVCDAATASCLATHEPMRTSALETGQCNSLV
jgi:hypothetical protein